MARDTNKFIDELVSRGDLPSKGEVRYGFIGRTKPPAVAYLFMGPLFVLLMKQYQVVVLHESILFVRISPLGAISEIDTFQFSELSEFAVKKGRITSRLRFTFKNGRALSLTSNSRALVTSPYFLVTDEAVNFIRERVR